MTTFITSDLHINHARILDYQPNRAAKWKSVEEMNEGIIDYWTHTVRPNDELFVVGDLMMGHHSFMEDFLKRMTGKVHLVLGNHDFRIRKNPEWHKYFERVDQYREIRVGATKVCLMHFPIAFWNQAYQGSVHFHGHLHCHPSGLQGRIKDVGIDGHPNLEFHVLDDLVTEMMSISITRDHHEGGINYVKNQLDQ